MARGSESRNSILMVFRANANAGPDSAKKTFIPGRLARKLTEVDAWQALRSKINGSIAGPFLAAYAIGARMLSSTAQCKRRIHMVGLEAEISRNSLSRAMQLRQLFA